MSGKLARLDAFIANWRARLERQAEVHFAARSLESPVGTPAHIADDFAHENGFKRIGFDWELLDAEALPSEDRSAIGAFRDALSRDLAMRTGWLGDDQARECAREFLDAFDPATRMVVTNHIVRSGGESEGWFPISDATFEWAFVAYDERKIALLIVTAED